MRGLSLCPDGSMPVPFWSTLFNYTISVIFTVYLSKMLVFFFNSHYVPCNLSFLLNRFQYFIRHYNPSTTLYMKISLFILRGCSSNENSGSRVCSIPVIQPNLRVASIITSLRAARLCTFIFYCFRQLLSSMIYLAISYKVVRILLGQLRSKCTWSIAGTISLKYAAMTINCKAVLWNVYADFTQHYENMPIQIYWEFYNQTRIIFR